jgi:MscS family membrane protein
MILTRLSTKMMRVLPLIGVTLVTILASPALAQEGTDSTPSDSAAATPSESDAAASWIRARVPEVLKGDANQVLGVEYWQWIGLLAIILLGLILDQTVRFVLRGIVNRLIVRRGYSADHSKAVLQAVRPVGLLVAAIFWLNALGIMALQEEAEGILQGSAKVFAVLAATWAAWRFTDLISQILSEKAARSANRFDDVLVPLVRKTVKVFIVVYALIFAAASLQIQLVPLLASLGIGGVAFAFASKDTVENFFGSVAVLIDRPFSVGDWVLIEGHEGTVEEIGFRSTRIRTFYDSQITVPNSNLVRAVVDNYGRRKYRRWKTFLGVQYDTPPQKLIAFTEGIRELVRTHPYTRKDYFLVYLNQFGPSSLDILLYIFHEVPDWSTELRERERMLLDIVRLAQHLGVEFAFPTQTVHLHRSEDAPDVAPSKAPEAQTDRAAALVGIDAVRALIAQQPWQQERPGAVTFGPAPGSKLGGESD